MARMDHVRSAHGHRNVRHPIQRVAEQSLFYSRYSVTTSGFPETQQPRPDHPTVGGGGASEDVETTYQTVPADLAKDTKLVTALEEISEDTGLHRGLEKRGEITVASGGTIDIWRGTLNDKPTAFNAFHVYPQDLQEARDILWKLVPIWKSLVHENVLPFRSVDTSIFQLALVYDWGCNGDIMEYLESHPNVSRPKLLLQVAKGLQYLHSLEIVYGDLKGANVAISETGTAQVCDYGLSSIISNPIFTTAATPGAARSSRWLAPEVIDPPEPSSKPMTVSKSADVFAFAMLAVEVFSGKVPFGNMKNESVIIQIATGKRPQKPQTAGQLGLTAEMWKFIEKCWSANPGKRPTIDEVVRAWEGFVNGDNSRASVSKASARQSYFARLSNTYAKKRELSPDKIRFFCLL